MTPSYDIKPGAAVGPFQLGDSLWTVLELLRTRKNEYPKVDISWDDTAPHTSAVVVHIPHLSLYFPRSITQHLELIRLPDVHSSAPSLPGGAANVRCNLTYDAGQQVLLSKTTKLTRGVVGRVLGPTYAAQGANLDYPGVSFKLASSDAGSSGRDDIVQSIDVVPKENQAGPSRVWKGIRGCNIRPGKGAVFELPNGEQLDISFEMTTSQDILLDLGPPIRKYWKEDDRMSRTWGYQGDKYDEDDDDGDCFWNYFQYGVDFLMSRAGEIKRIIVHSNIPGTPLFQRYARCPWTIQSPDAPLDMFSKSSDISNVMSQNSTSLDAPSPYLVPPSSGTPEPPSEGEPLTSVHAPNNTSGKKKKKKTAGIATPSSALSSSPANPDMDSEIPAPAQSPAANGTARAVGDARSTGSREGRGMLLDRIGEGGLDGVQGGMTSKLVGYEGLIVEEDVASGAITAVTVYPI